MTRNYIRPALLTAMWILITWIAWHQLDHLWAALITLLIIEHTLRLWLEAQDQ